MPRIIELGTSRKRKGGLEPTGGEMLFLVQGVTLGTEALDLVLSRSPEKADGLLRDDPEISIEPVEADVWSASVPYKPLEGGSNQEPSDKPANQNIEEDWTAIEFDATGAEEHATQCIQQIEYGPRSAQDIKESRVVGLKKDGVEGYSRVVPRLNFSMTIRVPAITIFHLDLINRLTGKTNSNAIFGMSPGCVLFMGLRGRIPKISKKPKELTVSFSVMRARHHFKVGDIEIPEKAGWDYLWVMYRKAVLNDRMVDVPDVVFVSQIYERDDLSLLNKLYLPDYAG